MGPAIKPAHQDLATNWSWGLFSIQEQKDKQGED